MNLYIYLIFFLGLLIFAYLAMGNKDSRDKTIYLGVLCFAIWMLMGLRDVTIGTDTKSYVHIFERACLYGNNWLESVLTKMREPLFYIITWLVSLFSDNYTAYLLVWAGFPAIGLFIILNRYLNNTIECYEALIVLCMLGLYAFFVAGIRQTAAISIVLISFKYLQNANFWKFAMCIAIAAMIHNSVIMFLIAYPLRWAKIKWWYIIVLLIVLILSTKIKLDIIVKYSALLFGNRFESYGTIYQSSQNMSAFFVQLALFLICFIKIKPLISKDTTNNILFVLITIGLFFQSLAGLLAEMSRISFYFSAFAIILVPRALQEYPPRYRPLVNGTFIMVCLFLLLFVSKSNLPIYKFA